MNSANYSLFKLELLAFLWVATEKYAPGDCKAGGLKQRWIARFSKFNFKIRYQLGCWNTNVDAIFRSHIEEPIGIMDAEHEEVIHLFLAKSSGEKNPHTCG